MWQFGFGFAKNVGVRYNIVMLNWIENSLLAENQHISIICQKANALTHLTWKPPPLKALFNNFSL